MTAELESQIKEGDKTAENGEKEDPEKKSSKNGNANELEKPKEADEKEIEIEVEDNVKTSDEPIAPRRPGFFGKLFERFKKADDPDVEAGTELLAKTDDVQSPDKEEKAADATAEDEKKEDTDGKGDTSLEKKVENLEKEVKRLNKKRKSLLAFLAILLILGIMYGITSHLTGGHARGPKLEPVVNVDCGLLRGTIQDEVYVFKGIRYAVPLTNEDRWKASKSPSSIDECWNGTYDGLNSSAYCFQKPILGVDLEMSEDCLFLDIITPSLAPPKLRPVVVFVPGVSPLQGLTASDLRWQPSTTLADEKDVTFVTVQYRMGVFGFMSLEVLKSDGRPPASGNYGLMDIITALNWVQKNIRSFGGDPHKVTVLGHGGSATAGLALLSSKKAKNLFSKMWLSAPSAYFTKRNLTDVNNDNLDFLKKLDCDTKDCLYKKSSQQLLEATPGFWQSDWSIDLPSAEEDEEKTPVMAVIDGNILNGNPNEWSSEHINRVPIVIGSGAQEAEPSKVLSGLENWSWVDFNDYINEKIGRLNSTLAAEIIQEYAMNSSTPMEQLYTLISNIRITCPLQQLNEKLAETFGQDSLYWYIVNHKPTSPVQFSNNSAASQLSVHGLDIAAIFGLLPQFTVNPSDADVKFQKNVQDLFYNFVYNGVPTIYRDTMMPYGFYNLIGSTVNSPMIPLDSCVFLNNTLLVPTYAKMN